jgi:hypothetical protein
MPVRRSPLVARFSLPVTIAAIAAIATGWSLDARAQSVWADVEVGVGRAALPNSFNDAEPTKLDPAFGLGAGVRFSAWTIGLRGHVVPTSSFTFYQGVLEAGFHPSAGRWDPYVSVHGGYAVMSMHALDLSAFGPLGSVAPPNPRGPDLGLGLGVDYRVTPLFALGIGVTGDVLFLSAPASYSNAGPGEQQVLLFTGGSGVGSAVIGTIHAGWRFEI